MPCVRGEQRVHAVEDLSVPEGVGVHGHQALDLLCVVKRNEPRFLAHRTPARRRPRGEPLIGAASAAIKMFLQTAALEAKRHGVGSTRSRRPWCPVRKGPHAPPPTASALSSLRWPPWADLGVIDAHDQAGLVIYLASPAGAGLTVQAISLNGGISAA